ncbi:hypothetical protein EYI48_08270 [Campylobacter coli]|nr:hypothetical protein [Campylobacter coli]
MVVANNIKVLDLSFLEKKGNIEIVSKNKIRSSGKFIFTYKAKVDFKYGNISFKQCEHFQREF